MNIDDELRKIFESDTSGLLDVKPQKSSAVTADDRLVASFEEINAFVEKNGQEPVQSRDINERKLSSRLKSLRENSEKSEALQSYDRFHLLESAKLPQANINTIDDILNDDALGLLSDGETADDSDILDIFRLNNLPKPISKTDYIAQREPCQEFDKFEPLFKQHHAELVSGEKVAIPFKSQWEITADSMFVLQGMLVYIAGVSKDEKKKARNIDARLYCVFENGTESHMWRRSLASALWKGENSRQIVPNDQLKLFEKSGRIMADDEATGSIYVLRSLSTDPKIQELDDLYKIGFSSQSIQERIQHASQDPTFLMADVKPVTEFQTFNVNPQKVEHLLHRFFANVCLNLNIFDNNKKRHTPQEWFIVPLHMIEIAVGLLIDESIVDYRYDHQQQAIVAKESQEAN